MKIPIKHITWLLIAFFCTAIVRVGYAQEPQSQEGEGMAQLAETEATSEEILITHPEKMREPLTLNQARAIFSLRVRQWPDGSRITVVVMRDEEPVHQAFLRNVLKILPHQLRRHWDRYIYSGTGQGPIVVHSQEEMVTKVNKIPGAIGYVERGVPHEQVSPLAIE